MVGSESELSFTLPAAIRAGVELPSTPAWRVEAALAAPAIGAEWYGHQRMLGAGDSYETTAAPTGYVSVLTVDSAKRLLGIGGGYEAGGWRIGASLVTPIRDQPARRW